MLDNLSIESGQVVSFLSGSFQVPRWIWFAIRFREGSIERFQIILPNVTRGAGRFRRTEVSAFNAIFRYCVRTFRPRRSVQMDPSDPSTPISTSISDSRTRIRTRRFGDSESTSNFRLASELACFSSKALGSIWSTSEAELSSSNSQNIDSWLNSANCTTSLLIETSF